MLFDYSELTVSLKGSGLLIAASVYLFSMCIIASLNTQSSLLLFK